MSELFENDQPIDTVRGREILTRGEGHPAMISAASAVAKRVDAIKGARDTFDFDAKQVGLRDSTWLVIGGTIVTLCVAVLASASKIDRLPVYMLLIGGTTMLSAVIMRDRLGSH